MTLDVEFYLSNELRKTLGIENTWLGFKGADPLSNGMFLSLPVMFSSYFFVVIYCLVVREIDGYIVVSQNYISSFWVHSKACH